MIYHHPYFKEEKKELLCFIKRGRLRHIYLSFPYCPLNNFQSFDIQFWKNNSYQYQMQLLNIQSEFNKKIEILTQVRENVLKYLNKN